jgi:hypothetical protein
MSERWRFRALLLLSALIGLALSLASWSSITILARHPTIVAIISLLFPKLGEALIIAPVLAIVVDEAAKRKLLKEFAEDISTHMVGGLLPPVLRAHIHQYLKLNFVRDNWDIEYTIAKVPGKEGFIELQTKSSYDVENRSPFEQEYRFFYEVENSWFPDVGETQITEVKGPGVQLKKGDSSFKTASVGGFTTFEKIVRMPPYDPHKRNSYRFEVESVEFFKDGSFSPFIAAVPVLNLTLTVFYPKDHLHLDLNLSFDDVAKATKCTELQQGTQWVLKTPMLPGQSLLLRWEPTNISTKPAALPGQMPPMTPTAQV